MENTIDAGVLAPKGWGWWWPAHGRNVNFPLLNDYVMMTSLTRPLRLRSIGKTMASGRAATRVRRLPMWGQLGNDKFKNDSQTFQSLKISQKYNKKENKALFRYTKYLYMYISFRNEWFFFFYSRWKMPIQEKFVS